jgi:hypothetical protein
MNFRKAGIDAYSDFSQVFRHPLFYRCTVYGTPEGHAATYTMLGSRDQ